jgi:hypothetical protein
MNFFALSLFCTYWVPAIQHLLVMGKSKKGKGGKPSKLGAPDHFSGFKLDFLVARANKVWTPIPPQHSMIKLL